LYFAVSGLKNIIGHRNPNNNLESSCICKMQGYSWITSVMTFSPHDRNSNQTPSEYKSETSLPEPAGSVEDAVGSNYYLKTISKFRTRCEAPPVSRVINCGRTRGILLPFPDEHLLQNSSVSYRIGIRLFIWRWSRQKYGVNRSSPFHWWALFWPTLLQSLSNHLYS
jgi:hypothetical protein